MGGSRASAAKRGAWPGGYRDVTCGLREAVMETRPTSRWPDLWAPTVVVRGTRWPEAAGADPVRGRPMSSCRAQAHRRVCHAGGQPLGRLRHPSAGADARRLLRRLGMAEGNVRGRGERAGVPRPDGGPGGRRGGRGVTSRACWWRPPRWRTPPVTSPPLRPGRRSPAAGVPPLPAHARGDPHHAGAGRANPCRPSAPGRAGRIRPCAAWSCAPGCPVRRPSGPSRRPWPGRRRRCACRWSRRCWTSTGRPVPGRVRSLR